MPVTLAATLAAGLPEHSRSKMKSADLPVPADLLLLAEAVDRLSLLVWMQTEDGQKGRHQPQSIVDILINRKQESDVEAYDSIEDYEKERARRLEAIRNGN